MQLEQFSINVSHFLHFGLDFLRVRVPIEGIWEMICHKSSYLDDDNSNFSRLWIFDFEFSMTRVGDWFILRPVDFGHAVIRVRFEAHAVVDFYSSFFLWEGEKILLRDLEQWNPDILRVDIALDVMDLSVDDFSQKIKTDLSCSRLGIGKNGTETFYVGNWKSKRKIIRIYNKKLDNQKKEKADLYPQYDDIKLVTRLEIELRSQACKRLSMGQLQDPCFLWNLFRRELNTIHVFLFLPEFQTWWTRKKIARGVPAPVLRFREACERAVKNGVDIFSEVLKITGRSI